MTDLLHIGNRTFRPITAEPEPKPETELDRLRKKMWAKYDSQTDAARAWGVTRSYVSSICVGRRRIPDFVKEDLGIE